MKNNKTPFIHVGNNLTMDFLNTQFVSHEKHVDLLSCVDDLRQWASEVNLNIGIHIDDTLENNNLAAVHAFRQSLRDLIVAHINKEVLPEESLLSVNRYLLHNPSQKKLEMIENELSLQALNDELSIQQLLGKIALDAATLLTSTNGANLKRCSNNKCVLMFVDVSRSKKRRWCSMDRCGNRAKANAFYHSNK